MVAVRQGYIWWKSAGVKEAVAMELPPPDTRILAPDFE